MESSTRNTERHGKEGKALNDADVDNAKLFLDGILINGGLDVPLGKVRRLIDWRIIPIMFCCYTLQFLDKVILNYAAVMSLGQDLKLRGNDFSNANTFTFVALLIAEIPNGDTPFIASRWSDCADVLTGWVLNKMAAGRWLGSNVFAWGISTACVAAARNYVHLLIARIFLGIFEASIGPCLMIIRSQWYTKSEQPIRFASWVRDYGCPIYTIVADISQYTGLGIGQVVGALTSFGFQHVQSSAFSGWRIMFVVLGIITSIVGVITYFSIPDSPMTAA